MSNSPIKHLTTFDSLKHLTKTVPDFDTLYILNSHKYDFSPVIDHDQEYFVASKGPIYGLPTPKATSYDLSVSCDLEDLEQLDDKEAGERIIIFQECCMRCDLKMNEQDVERLKKRAHRGRGCSACS